MSPNPYGSSTLCVSETNSAEPVQIISKPGFQQYVPPQVKPQVRPSGPQYKWQIVWRNVIIFIYLHATALYGFYCLPQASWKTVVFTLVYTWLASFGITCGAHRLWAHRSYKATLPLRIILAIFQTTALQNHIYEWVRDHRVHHKFTDTDADPHNSRRGFFFSHMGWLMVKKHKDVFTKGKTVDMSDVEADPVCRFQKKYYVILAPLLCFVVPSAIPWYFWNEDLLLSWNLSGVGKYVFMLHSTWLVNSAAHMWGSRPYDKSLNPAENRFVAFFSLGEGWHNYHHVFPWDYKTAELGDYSLNMSTAILDLMAKIGWAYDLKTVNPDVVGKRAQRTGDGSRRSDLPPEEDDSDDQQDHPDHIWGWDDRDLSQEDKRIAKIYNSKSE